MKIVWQERKKHYFKPATAKFDFKLPPLWAGFEKEAIDMSFKGGSKIVFLPQLEGSEIKPTVNLERLGQKEKLHRINVKNEELKSKT